MTNLKPALLALLLFTISNPLYAERDLDGSKAEKLEIRHSMLGFRSTLVFYTFKEERAILQLTVGNKDETFPVSGKVHLFDQAIPAEGLKKWINNQHSDGLFPDIPQPIFTGVLPKETCTISSRKQTGTSENPGPRRGVYKDFELGLSMKAHTIDKTYNLSAFTDTVRVHVESK